MRLLKVFISGAKDDLRREHDVIERTFHSLHIDGARVDIKYSDEHQSPDAIQALVYKTERVSQAQSVFVERILQQDDSRLLAFEFDSLVQLEEQFADALTALIHEQFELKVTRPIFQAPSRLETFVGREAQIEKLVDILAPGQVVIIRGVSDAGGMGKSELATWVVHLLRHQFTDGVLWANIQTARPADLLTAWARAYGGFPSLGRGDLRF